MIRIPPYDRSRMSRISTTWDIGRSSGHCAATGVPLEPGSQCIVALVEREEDLSAPLARLDFSEQGWESPQRPKGVIAFWRAVVPAPNEKRRGFVDDQTLLDLFERLGSDERPHRVRFRFVLMLLLVRKRLLRVVGTESANEPSTPVAMSIVYQKLTASLVHGLNIANQNPHARSERAQTLPSRMDWASEPFATAAVSVTAGSRARCRSRAGRRSRGAAARCAGQAGRSRRRPGRS